MNFSVYVLRSLRNGDLYIGSTEDFDNRIKLHNCGRVKSTKAYRPWELLEIRGCDNRGEAMKLEKFLKSHQQKEILKKKFNLL